MIAGTVVSVVIPLLYKKIIDTAVSIQQVNSLLIPLIILLSLTGLEQLILLFQTIVSTNIQKKVFAKLRTDLYEHLQKMSLQFHSKNNSGVLLSKLTNDVNSVQNLLTPSLIGLLKNVLLILIILIIVSFISIRIVLASLLLFPFFFLVFGVFKRKVYDLSNRVQEKQERMLKALQENITSIKSIQSFNVEGEKLIKAKEQIDETENAKRERDIKSAFASFSTISISLLGTVLLWGLGSYEVVKGSISIGSLIAILYYFNNLNSLITSSFGIALNFQTSLPSVKRIFEILDMVPDIKDAPDAKEIAEFKGDISFKKVSFAYEHKMYIFNHVDIEISAGSIVGIVGASGQGKTTLINLIPRFYDPSEGSITIDGMDIRKIKLESLRKNIASVPQDTVLFDSSIKDNITMGRKNITSDQIINSAILADAHDFIMKLPQGYNTQIGEKGVLLSGGQKKRIAIARALLNNPRIIILDEATADLDEVSEKSIIASIQNLAKSRTIFFITHKLSLLTFVDKILSVESGRITEYCHIDDYMNDFHPKKVLHLN